MDTNEKWLPIPGYEGLYEISNAGQVRGISRFDHSDTWGPRRREGVTLSPDNGRVRLRSNGVTRSVSIQGVLRNVFPAECGLLDEPGEQWAPIPGYEAIYEISNRGRVKRTADKVDGRVAQRLLKISRNNGYLVAHLCPQGSNGNGHKLYVETVVKQLFGSSAPEVPNLSEHPRVKHLTKDVQLASLPGEEWRSIYGYEALYQISNFGRVLSLARIINDGQGRSRFVRARIRVNGTDAGGYPKTELAQNGKTKTVLIHRLVANAFIPNPLNLAVVHHKDEDKTNCRADNLEWASNASNVQDWFDRRRVVVSTDTIQQILAAASTGKTPGEILAALPRKRKPRKS